jgi:hypothetical protein
MDYTDPWSTINSYSDHNYTFTNMSLLHYEPLAGIPLNVMPYF